MIANHLARVLTEMFRIPLAWTKKLRDARLTIGSRIYSLPHKLREPGLPTDGSHMWLRLGAMAGSGQQRTAPPWSPLGPHCPEVWCRAKRQNHTLIRRPREGAEAS